MKKALFLDRDGVINVDTKYLHKKEDVVFVDGIFELCIKAQQQGYILIVVTNQAGIAKGYFSENDVITLHQWMQSQFAERGITITDFYYCPYHKDGTVEHYKKESDCRKPKPGLFLKAARDHDIDIGSSLMVGDKLSDRIQLVNLKCVVIKSKYCEKEFDYESLQDVMKIL